MLVIVYCERVLCPLFVCLLVGWLVGWLVCLCGSLECYPFLAQLFLPGLRAGIAELPKEVLE